MSSKVKIAGCGDMVYVEAGEKPPAVCERCNKEWETFLDMYEDLLEARTQKSEE